MSSSLTEDDVEGDFEGDPASKVPFDVTLGLRLEAKDYNGLWYPAKVMDIDDEKQVCYEIDMTEFRLIPISFWRKEKTYIFNEKSGFSMSDKNLGSLS